MSLMDEELFKAKRKVSSIRKMGKSHEQIVHRERNKTSLKHTKRSWISFGIREMQKYIYIYIIWRLHYSSIILTKITKFSNTVCEAVGEQHASALLLAVQSGTIITEGNLATPPQIIPQSWSENVSFRNCWAYAKWCVYNSGHHSEGWQKRKFKLIMRAA